MSGPHLRVEIGYFALRAAWIAMGSPRDMEWFQDLIESVGFKPDPGTIMWYAEPATEEQLQLACEIYGCVDPKALGELGVAWTMPVTWTELP